MRDYPYVRGIVRIDVLADDAGTTPATARARRVRGALVRRFAVAVSEGEIGRNLCRLCP